MFYGKNAYYQKYIFGTAFLSVIVPLCYKIVVPMNLLFDHVAFLGTLFMMQLEIAHKNFSKYKRLL